MEFLTDNLPRIGNFPKCDNPLQYTMDEIVERIADHLIAHGVTVQKWIPVTERLPDRNDMVIAFYPTMRGTSGEMQIHKAWAMSETCTHWMPLPSAPEDLK